MDWNRTENQDLVTAFLALRNVPDARRFLRDLLTEEEIIEFGKRFKSARMLAEGSSYSEIESATGLSSTTIARVSKWLKGKGGGYRQILHRLHKKKSSKSRR